MTINLHVWLLMFSLSTAIDLNAVELTQGPLKETIVLFNGKDLTGWSVFPPTEAKAQPTWAVRNGMIHCTGKPNGYLKSTVAYADYQVVLEWRFIKAGNTGLIVHINGPDKVWPTSVECQGMSKRQGDFYFWEGATADGTTPLKNGKGSTIKMTATSAEHPVGEWNTFRVICRGDTIAMVVNDVETNKLTGCSLRSGPFGIQSEGAEIEIRSVIVEPLKP